MRDLSTDELIHRVWGLWGRPSPSHVVAEGDRAWDVLAEHGFDPPRAAMAVVWGDDFIALATALLETGALLSLTDEGASGDVHGCAEEIRFLAELLALWAAALQERVADELAFESAEKAAGVARLEERSFEERACWEARSAQARKEAEVRRSAALDDRRSLIDILRVERKRHIASRVAYLAAESRERRGDCDS